MTSTSQTPDQVRHAPTGQLWAADGFSVPVNITHRDDDILVAILERADEFIEGPLTYMTLESAGRRGVVRTRGNAVLLESNLLRFVVDETPALLQRREFVRVTLAKRIVLESEDGDVLADALTVDISGGGLLVQLPRPVDLPAEDEIYFTLYLGLTEYDERVGGGAKVVRKAPDDRVVLGFRIDRREQERLIRYLFERQRIALAVTRGDSS